MARTTPAPSARLAGTRGWGAASQSDAGGRPISIQGETEGAKVEEEKREEEGSKESEDDKDQEDDEDSGIYLFQRVDN